MQALETETNEAHQLADGPLAPTDSELLMDFVVHRRQEAFTQLVGKHAAMVLGVCRQILRDRHEAEDVFQATFIILAEQAGTIKKSASVGAWLHQVAYRTAMRAARRRQQRRTEPLDDVATDDDIWTSIARQERQTALHEELARLPQRYRDALVLCYLEGMSRSEAADELECTESSIKAALARARRMLRMRLARRGILLSAAFGFACAATNSAKANSLTSLVAITAETVTAAVLRGETACITTNIGSLAREGVTAMKLTATLRIVVPTLLVFGAGAALMLSRSYAGPRGTDGESGRVAAQRDRAAVFAANPTPTALPVDATMEVTLANDDPLPGSTGTLPLVDQGNPSPRLSPAILAPKDRAERSPSTTATPEELALEVDYLQAKIKALLLYAKAKSLEAEGFSEAKRQGIAHNARLGGTVSQSEIRALDAKLALASAEAANVEAEVIRLRRDLSVAERHVSESRSAKSGENPSQGRRIAVGDLLQVESVAAEARVQRDVRVEQEGTIALGAEFGRVKVVGLTLAEAEAKVQEEFHKHFSKVSVQITFR